MLRRVMGVDGNHDPDQTYELTIDNMKKLLAIHMRLRYSCIKTRLLTRFILVFMSITLICIHEYKYCLMITVSYYRCGIPVILMGETGCGKTRLIKFMCELRAGREKVRNMLLVKVRRFFFLVITIQLVWSSNFYYQLFS